MGVDQGAVPVTATGGPSPSPSLVRRSIDGAAQGAVAAVALAAFEIATHAADSPVLADPRADLARVVWGGLAVGVALGALRRIRRLAWIAPAGIALGIGIALHVWFAWISGGGLAGGTIAAGAVRGAFLILLGVGLGQFAGAALRPVAARSLPTPAAVVLIVLALLPGVLPVNAPRTTGGGRNILLLTIDTLRADRLGTAGCPRPLTPHLDRLARRGILDIRVRTPLPRTLPAFASIMTGNRPPAHGVRDNFHYRLGDDAVTAAERLRDAGWATAAVNSNPVLSHGSGIYQGFESANDRGDDWSRLLLVRGVAHLRALLAMRSGDRALVIADLASDWLGRRPREQPFFLWVHWLSPHMPYGPAYPFDRLWTDDDDPASTMRHFDYGQVSKGEMTYRNPLTEAERTRAMTLYDGEVATADRALGRLLERMEAADDLENTFILFTSDHGESLDEHGYFFNHGDFVYGPAAKVPHIRAGVPDGEAGSLESRTASLIDALPLLIGEATGRPLAGRLRDESGDVGDGDGDEPDAAAVDGAWPPPSTRRLLGESGFCRFPHLNDRLDGQLPQDIAQNPDLVEDWGRDWEDQANRAKQRSLETETWKLVRSPGATGATYELFDLRADPGESRDVAPQHAAVVDSLALELDSRVAADEARVGTADDRILDDTMREQMEALGYLGD